MYQIIRPRSYIISIPVYQAHAEGGREVETASWQQAATLEHLERHHPGITQVRRDQYGTIIAEPEDTSIETLLQELRCEVTRGEAQLNAP
jgi:hypothetical protein